MNIKVCWLIGFVVMGCQGAGDTSEEPSSSVSEGLTLATVSYSAANGTFVDKPLNGFLKPGFTLQATTCGSNSGDTLLQLVDTDTGEIVSVNDDACGGLASSVVYTVPFPRRLTLRMRCFGQTACSATAVAAGIDNANGLVPDPVAALNAIPLDPTGQFSVNVNQLFGLSGNSYHIQGVQRVPRETESQFPLYFSVSAQDDALHSAQDNNRIYGISLPSRGALASDTAIGSNSGGAIPGDIALRSKSSLPFDCSGAPYPMCENHSGGIFASGRFLFDPSYQDDHDGANLHVMDMAPGTPALLTSRKVPFGYVAAMAVHHLQGQNDSATQAAFPSNYQPAACTGSVDLRGAWIQALAGGSTSKIYFTVRPTNLPGSDHWVDMGELNDPLWQPLGCTGLTDCNGNTPSQQTCRYSTWDSAIEPRWAAPGNDTSWGTYQFLSFLGSNSGSLFLVGGGNLDETNWVDLWQIFFNGQTMTGSDGVCSRFICLKKAAMRKFRPTNGVALYRGGGLYIADSSSPSSPFGRLFLYGTAPGAVGGYNGTLQLNEWAAPF